MWRKSITDTFTLLPARSLCPWASPGIHTFSDTAGHTGPRCSRDALSDSNTAGAASGGPRDRASLLCSLGCVEGEVGETQLNIRVSAPSSAVSSQGSESMALLRAPLTPPHLHPRRLEPSAPAEGPIRTCRGTHRLHPRRLDHPGTQRETLHSVMGWGMGRAQVDVREPHAWCPEIFPHVGQCSTHRPGLWTPHVTHQFPSSADRQTAAQTQVLPQRAE